MQWNRHKEAKQTIKEIFQRLDRYRIIHYSCQSFNRVENGKSTIIAAIAIYLPQYDRTESFDIQSTAEYLNIEYKDINKNLEKIEKVINFYVNSGFQILDTEIVTKNKKDFIQLYRVL